MPLLGYFPQSSVLVVIHGVQTDVNDRVTDLSLGDHCSKESS